jgi:hypothetical protein
MASQASAAPVVDEWALGHVGQEAKATQREPA